LPAPVESDFGRVSALKIFFFFSFQRETLSSRGLTDQFASKILKLDILVRTFFQTFNITHLAEF
jgi:hypothetical protein